MEGFEGGTGLGVGGLWRVVLGFLGFESWRIFGDWDWGFERLVGGGGGVVWRWVCGEA